MNTYPDHRQLYRLPWTLPDNPITWLEPTAACNIYCEGCYRAQVKDGHKSLDTVREELETFARHRTFDGVSIAGGDPLTHPEIVKITAMVKEMGYKPIVNTNGVALTDDLLAELVKAGVQGFTFHVDSKQARPGWKGKNELELNELRLQLAERLARAGNVSCAFNATVYQDTLQYAPGVVEWAQKHIDKVHVVVFIAYRQASGGIRDSMDFWVGDKKIEMEELVYSRPTGEQRLDISSRDVVAEIRTRFPDFAPCAYLNGTEKADSLKWLLTLRVGSASRIDGYLGPRFAELAQVHHHMRHGRYLSYAAPSLLRRGRSACLAASPFDRTARRVFAKSLLRPWRRLHLQSIMCIQPVDILEDGRMNMCDGCPDVTVHEGELVWSCRLEERIKHGGFARGVPRETVEA